MFMISSTNLRSWTMRVTRPTCAAPRAPAMNKELVNQIIILGEELNLPVIAIMRNSSAATWRHSTADLCQPNCCSSAKSDTIAWQRRLNGALGIRYPPSRRYLIISAIATLPVGYQAGRWTPPTTLPALFQPRCRVGGPQFPPPLRPKIPSFARRSGGIEQQLLFWCLLVCCIDGQVREEGGSQEMREGFLLRG